MLRSLNDLRHYRVSASDGEIGKVVDFLFDDQTWAIRYLVVETSALGGRRVLVSPRSFRKAEWSTQSFHLDLTVDRVKNSPDIDTARPVSRQHEREVHDSYDYPYDWGGPGLAGAQTFPTLLSDQNQENTKRAPGQLPDDIHLRSAAELRGYYVEGTDGAVGHVSDMIVDDATWQIRFLSIDARSWWFGKKVLVAPTRARTISWEYRKMQVDRSRQQIRSGPRMERGSSRAS